MGRGACKGCAFMHKVMDTNDSIDLRYIGTNVCTANYVRPPIRSLDAEELATSLNSCGYLLPPSNGTAYNYEHEFPMQIFLPVPVLQY